MTQATDFAQLAAMVPVLALALGAVAILLLTVAGGEHKLAPPGGVHLLAIALLSLGAAAYALCTPMATSVSTQLMQGALVRDGLSSWFGTCICLATALSIWLAFPVLTAQGMATGEYMALSLLSCAGGVTVAMAGDMLSMFLGIELLSVPAYVLAGFRRSSARSQEAALKYFVYGAFASAFIIFGMAVLWGESGRTVGHPTMLWSELMHVVHVGGLGWLGQAGLIFVLSGLLFKVAAVPFHMWAPDVYEGAPTPASGFLSVVVKLAGFAALLRFVAVSFASVSGAVAHHKAVQLFTVLAALSVVVGNVMTVRQRQVKRMLAYSSIAHAGYAMVGLVAMVDRPAGGALAAIGNYLLGYIGMGLGAFAVVSVLEGPQENRHDFDFERLAGAGRRAPALGMAATVFMLGLAGVPPTSGFFGKAVLFGHALSCGHVGLVVLAALCSVVGAYSYLRLLALMLLRKDEAPASTLSSPWLTCGLFACAAMTLWLGVLPERAYALARATLATWWLGV